MNRSFKLTRLGLCLLIVLSSRAILAEELPGELDADAQAAQKIDAAVRIIGDDSRDIEDRLNAMYVLYVSREYGPQDEKTRSAAEKAIPMLTRILQEKKDYGTTDRSIVPGQLVGQSVPVAQIPMRDFSSEFRHRGDIGFMTGIPLAQCNDDGLQLRVSAVHALGRLKDRQIIPALTRALENVSEGEEHLSITISGTLMEFGPEAAEAVPALLKVLEMESHTEEAYGARISAAAALGAICATEAVPLLSRIPASQEATPDSRLKQEHQLLRMQPAASLIDIYAEQHFQKYYFHSSQVGYARKRAAEAVKAQEEIKASFQTLVNEKQDIEDRIAAAWTLGSHGPDAKRAVPALVRILDEKKDYGVPVGGPEKERGSPVPLLARSLGSLWLKGHGDIGYQRTAHFVSLPDAQQVDLGLSFREAVAYALGRTGSREAVPALIRALESSSEAEDHLRITVCGALLQFGPEASAAGPALLKILEAESRTPEAYALRINAVAILGAIGSPEAVPTLAKLGATLYGNPDADVRWLHQMLKAQVATALQDIYMAELEAIVREDPVNSYQVHP